MTKTTAAAMPKANRTMPWGINARTLIRRIVSTAQPRELLSGYSMRTFTG